MSVNFKDIETMNQSFGNLADTLLRNRALDQQKQERADVLGFRERELGERMKQAAYERDPKTPENRLRGAQATVAEDAVKKLGISQVDASWTTADGQQITLKGSPDEIKKAAADNPPSPQSKVTSRFITKDGVEHVITGTPEQLKAQQETLAGAGGGIQTGGLETYNDEQGNSFPIYTDRRGNVHVIRDTGDTVTITEGQRDPTTGKINLTTTKTTAPGGGAGRAPAAKGRTITDSKGKKWIYTGTMADPTQDKNKANWTPAK